MTGTKVKADWKMERVCANLIRDTYSSVLVCFSSDVDYDKEVWIPKSIIKAIELDENGETKAARILTLPVWWLIKNEPNARRPESKNDNEWALAIKAQKLEQIARLKKPVYMAYLPHNGEVIKEISPACAAEIVENCEDSFSFILTRNKPLDHLLALILVYFKKTIY